MRGWHPLKLVPRSASRLIGSPQRIASCRYAADIASTPEPHLILVDGHALIMKMHFATLPSGLRNADGQLTGAAFLFSRAVLHLRNACSHMCVVFDYGSPEQLDRTKLRSDYKSARLEFNWMGSPGVPAHAVSSQVALCQDACQAFGVHWQHQSGKEADDLIASYALKGKSEGLKVTILSNDKDLMQVVGDGVCMNSSWNLSQKNLVDAAKVEQLFGVPASSLADVLALSGDNCDSVRGVQGLGAKKAGQVIKQYKTIEKLYQAIDSGAFNQPGFGPVLQKRLLESRELVLQNRQLVTLPFPTHSAFSPLDIHDLETLRVPGLNTSVAQEFIAKHDFDSLSNLVSGATRNSRRGKMPHGPAGASDGAFKITSLETAEQALQMLSAANAKDPTCVFALGMPETTTENHKKARTEEEQDMIRAKHSETEVMSSLSIAWAGSDQLLNSDGNKHSCIVIQKGCVEHIDALSDFFSKEQYRKVYYNFPRSVRLLEKVYSSLGTRKKKTFKHAGFAGDVLDMAFLWDPTIGSWTRPKGVLWLLRALERKDGDADDEMAPSATNGYCAILVCKLWSDLVAKLRSTSMMPFYEKHWLHLGPVCLDMQKIGVPVDTANVDKELATKRRRAELLQNSFRKWARCRVEEVYGTDVARRANIEMMDVSSARQVRQLLFGQPEAVPCSGVHVDRAEFDRSAFFEHLGLVDPEKLQRMTLEGLKKVSRKHGLAPSRKKKSSLLKKLEEHFIELLLRKKATELKELCKRYEIKSEGKKAVMAAKLYNVERMNRSSSAPKVLIPGLGLSLPAECEKDFINQKTGHPVLSRSSLKCLLESSLPSQHVDILGADGTDAIRTLIELADLELEVKNLEALQRRVAEDGKLHAHVDTHWILRRGRSSLSNAFCRSSAGHVYAPPKQNLIVARFSDLKLHIAALMGDCVAMQADLREGVHAKTARARFPNVQAAVNDGLPNEGIKMMFPSEWAKVQALNDGVLTGTSATRLARVWGISTAEMHKEIERWFQRYPGINDLKLRKVAAEVEDAKSHCTLLGRRQDIASRAYSTSRSALARVLEGSVVDVIIKTLQHLNESRELKKLGFKPILQIQEEILLAGPCAQAEEACGAVQHIMSNPLQGCDIELGSKTVLCFDARVQVSQSWSDMGESES
mmetsp:Transcript_54506/g.127352  ORF Transcript_54506/g.127352 Transcript_54506/m.127352 type:complete len:1151 (+) Transcript_54506:67-3519(+)